MNNLPDNIKNIKLNAKLIIETGREVLIGYVESFHPNYQFIELRDAVDFNNNYKFNNPQCIRLLDMQRILLLDNDYANDTINKIQKRTALRKRLCMNNCSVLQTPNKLDELRISANEWKLVDKQLENIVIIKQTDQLFHKACEDIRTKVAVSLMLQPWQTGRNQCLALIIIATNTHVYIFDVLALGEIVRGLRVLLEAEFPRKIVYRSNYVNDVLKHRYKFDLNGIFDIYVANCLTSKSINNYKLIEIAEKLLNIPASYFVIDEHFDSFKRPFSKAHLVMLAKLAIMQEKIYNKILYEIMLK